MEIKEAYNWNITSNMILKKDKIWEKSISFICNKK